MAQSPPFIFPLSSCDLDTLTAIGDLLSSVMVYQQRLDDANKQAQLDVLTGLLNRGAFELRAINLLQQDLPFGADYAFVIIDLDYFKRINDSCGHIVGDEVLKLLAGALRKFFRSTDLIGRMGGDEFAVFCSYVGEVDQLTHRIKKFQDIWNKTLSSAENMPRVQATLSFGIAVAPKDATTYKELFHKADIALYKSKQRGRNRYTLYDSETMSDI
jgi:diguanylate cyclase (GGDEF)-like protein